ncbi:MAG: VCBS repeat-containing protein, partial [Melioribacteraceae bacterium]
MRKEDLKMRYREEKIVLPADRSFLASIIFTLLFFSNLPAQIPINGFCRYREFSVDSDFTNITSVDYNADGYRDLLIFNNYNNRYISLHSDPKSNFVKIASKYSLSPITNIHPFGNETAGRRYLVESRSRREVSLASFSSNGSLIYARKLKFNGYPSGIDAADVDGDGRPEGLVSGNSLDGLYIIKETNRTLKETKIFEGKVFSWSCFIDLDYDSFADIGAVDQISNSLIFFSNDRAGNFIESRSIGLNGDVSEFKNADLNSDGFTDFIFVNNNRFEILLGDSVSSFSKKIFLDTPSAPDKFAILDFNGDGFNDIAYLNIQSGGLYLLYAKNSDSFYQPVLYMKKDGLLNLTAYIDRTGKKIALLSSGGKVYLINALRMNDSSFMVTLGTGQSAVQTFDYMNDKYRDFCFIDDESRSLKVALSERRKLLRTLFSVPLSKSHSSVKVDDINPRIKTYYCYSKGERLIEAVRINLDNGNYTKLILYADNKIEDLKIESDRLKDWQKISVLVRAGSELHLQILEIRDFRKTGSSAYPVASDTERGWIASDIYRDIYTISRSSEKIELQKYIFNKKIVGKKTLFSLTINPSDEISYDLVCFDEMVSRSKPVAALLTINRNSYLYYFSNKNIAPTRLRYAASNQPKLDYLITDDDQAPYFYYNLRDKAKLG